ESSAHASTVPSAVAGFLCQSYSYMKKVLLKRVALFSASAIALAVAFAGVAFFFVMTRTGQGIDQSAFNGARLGQRTVAPVALTLLDAIPITGVAIAV